MTKYIYIQVSICDASLLGILPALYEIPSQVCENRYININENDLLCVRVLSIDAIVYIVYSKINNKIRIHTGWHVLCVNITYTEPNL